MQPQCGKASNPDDEDFAIQYSLRFVAVASIPAKTVRRTQSARARAGQDWHRTGVDQVNVQEPISRAGVLAQYSHTVPNRSEGC